MFRVLLESASTDAVIPKLLVTAYITHLDTNYFSAFGGKGKLMMKNINFLTLLTFLPTFGVAETENDYKKSEHKAENDCIGVLSLLLCCQRCCLRLFNLQANKNQRRNNR